MIRSISITDNISLISNLWTMEEMRPVFREYLEYVEQFYDINDVSSWCDRAMENLSAYAHSEDRRGYVLRLSGTIVGFALVNDHLRFSDKGFSIAEFYIRESHGRKGYGRILATHVFARSPGHWEVAVSAKNHLALTFWEQVVSSYTGGCFLRKNIPSFSGTGFLFKK